MVTPDQLSAELETLPGEMLAVGDGAILYRTPARGAGEPGRVRLDDPGSPGGGFVGGAGGPSVPPGGARPALRRGADVPEEVGCGDRVGSSGSEAPALEVTRMRRRHLRGVMAIERQVYARPWSPNLFAAEITDPNNRCYLVARVHKEVVGYGGLICYGDEAHITNVAVDPMHQGHGIATRLMAELIPQAIEMGARAVSLEVRVTNWGAQRTLRALRLPPGRDPAQLLPRGERGRAHHVDRRRQDRGLSVAGWTRSRRPCPRACASRDHPRHRDLVRRDRRGGRGGRLPRPVESDRPPGASARALRGRRSRGRRAGARRVAEPVAGASADRGRHRVPEHRRRSPSRSAPVSSARCWSGWRRRRRCPSRRASPLIGVNHLEGHVWANFLEHGSRDPPYVALVVSGGHTMLVHMPRGPPPRGARADARRRSGGGVRQGREAPRTRVPRRSGAGRDGDRAAIRTRSASRARWRTRATSTSR